MKKSSKLQIGIAAVLMLAAVVFALFFFENSYAVLGMETGTALTADGLAAIPAPFVQDGVGYLAAVETAGLFGLDARSEGDEIVIRINRGQTIRLPISLWEADVAYIPVELFCDALGLTLQKSGGVFLLLQKGRAPNLSEAAEMIGFAGFEARFTASGEPARTVVPNVRYEYDQMCEDIAEMKALYPEIISVFSIGSSVEGRDLIAFSLGNGTREILLTASIHGCEYFGTNYVMDLADRLAYAWATGEQAAGVCIGELLNEVKFIIVPMLNPDGVNIAQNGRYAAADPAALGRMSLQDTGYYGWKTNANGVDLNRNFPLNWWQSNGVRVPGARYYHGPSAASEPEVQAMLALLKNTPYYLFMDIHLFGESIDWMDTITEQNEPLRQLHRELADAISEETGYSLWNPEDVSVFGGYMIDYARVTYGRPSLILEISWLWRPLESYFYRITAPIEDLAPFLAQLVIEMDEDWGAGLYASVNGRSVTYTGARELDQEHALHPDQLFDILHEMGVGAAFEDGLLRIFAGEKVFEFVPSDTLRPDEIAIAAEAGYFSLQELLDALGASFVCDGLRVTIEYWN